MAAFSNAGCSPATGTSVAAQTTIAKFAEIRSEAESLLQIALGVALDLGGLDAQKANFTTAYPRSENFSAWAQPPRPAYNLNDFKFHTPQEPPIPTLEAVTDIDIDANLPPLDTALMAKYVTVLCDILQNYSDGLPDAFVNALFQRAQNRVDEHMNAQALDMADDYRRQGWVIPAGVPAARIVGNRQLQVSLKAMISRDAKIKVYEASVEVFKAALAAATGYFKTWAEIFKDYIDAQASAARNQINRNSLLIDRMQALVALFAARSAAERARIESEAREYGVRVELFQACVSEGGAIAQRDAASGGLETERRTGAAQDALQAAELANAEVERNVQEAIANFQTQLDNFARVMAAHFQGLSVRASMSSGVGSSSGKSCSTSYSFSESLSS
jgi:hypothetical protein